MAFVVLILIQIEIFESFIVSKSKLVTKYLLNKNFNANLKVSCIETQKSP